MRMSRCCLQAMIVVMMELPRRNVDSIVVSIECSIAELVRALAMEMQRVVWILLQDFVVQRRGLREYVL